MTDLARQVGLSQSCTSRHLQALLRQGLVQRSRDGKRVMFRIDHDEPLVRDLIAIALPAGATTVDAQAFRPAPIPSSSRSLTTHEPVIEARPFGAPAGEPDPIDSPEVPATRSDDMEDYLL